MAPMILMEGTVLTRTRLALAVWEAGSPLAAAAAQAVEIRRQGCRPLLGVLLQAETPPARLFREEGRCLQQRHHSGRLLKPRTPKTSP